MSKMNEKLPYLLFIPLLFVYGILFKFLEANMGQFTFAIVVTVFFILGSQLSESCFKKIA